MILCASINSSLDVNGSLLRHSLIFRLRIKSPSAPKIWPIFVQYFFNRHAWRDDQHACHKNLHRCPLTGMHFALGPQSIHCAGHHSITAFCANKSTHSHEDCVHWWGHLCVANEPRIVYGIYTPPPSSIYTMYSTVYAMLCHTASAYKLQFYSPKTDSGRLSPDWSKCENVIYLYHSMHSNRRGHTHTTHSRAHTDIAQGSVNRNERKSEI